MKTGQIKQHMRTTKQNNKKANRIRKKKRRRITRNIQTHDKT